MNGEAEAILGLANSDKRYSVEAYLFVREALAWAADNQAVESDSEISSGGKSPKSRCRHVTGQQLCEGIREFAQNQYGYMSKLVLNSWGLYCTADFGNVVYNMIDVGIMRKSTEDRRSHFKDVYDFEDVFELQFRMNTGATAHRCSKSGISHEST